MAILTDERENKVHHVRYSKRAFRIIALFAHSLNETFLLSCHKPVRSSVCKMALVG